MGSVLFSFTFLFVCGRGSFKALVRGCFRTKVAVGEMDGAFVDLMDFAVIVSCVVAQAASKKIASSVFLLYFYFPINPAAW